MQSELIEHKEARAFANSASILLINTHITHKQFANLKIAFNK